MPPKRIIFIRHAEKPVDGGDGGVASDGTRDDESLTVRGWQRAGALARFFSSKLELQPQTIFASGIGHGSKSKRPIETVVPLVGLLSEVSKVEFVTDHLKDDLQHLVDDVLSRSGTVLVAWEHKRIPDLVALLPDPPDVPGEWPDDRFDIVWVFDRADQSWSFSQLPQLLLSGDRAN